MLAGAGKSRKDERFHDHPGAGGACRSLASRQNGNCFWYDLIARWLHCGSRYVRAVEWEGTVEER